MFWPTFRIGFSRRNSVLQLVLVAVLFSLTLADAQASQQSREPSIHEKPRDYLIATASTGGTYYPVGVGIATLVKMKLREAKGITLSAISSAGSTENVKLMANGEVQFALLQSLFGHYLWQGEGPIKPLGPQRELRAVTNLWPNVEHFLVRSDFVDSGTIADIDLLKDRYVSLGRRSSGSIESNRWLLSNLGAEVESQFNLVYAGYGASANAMQNGRISAMSTPSGVPNSSVTRTMASMGERVALLGFTEEQRIKADGGAGIWQPYLIPENTYPQQQLPVRTIAQQNFLAVRANVSEQDVYEITKSIYENLPFLRVIHGAMKSITLENAVTGLAIPLHPGAARYYREVGLEIPGHLDNAGQQINE